MADGTISKDVKESWIQESCTVYVKVTSAFHFKKDKGSTTKKDPVLPKGAVLYLSKLYKYIVNRSIKEVWYYGATTVNGTPVNGYFKIQTGYYVVVKMADYNKYVGDQANTTNSSSSSREAASTLEAAGTIAETATSIVDEQPDVEADLLINPNNTKVTVKMNQDAILTEARGIHGMPYQFMESVDRRYEGYKFGRKFTERIVARMPLLLITPGEPNYMTGFSSAAKAGILETLKDVLSGADQETDLTDMLENTKETARYFTLDFAYKEYYQYVNAMLRMGARFLNIAGRTYPEKNGKQSTLWKYDWSYHTNSNLPGVMSSEEYVAFYVESESQISESFSNSTTTSTLASKLSSGSDVANELKFIMGSYGASVDATVLDEEAFSTKMTQFNNVLNSSVFASNTLLKRLASDAKTIVAGGKIIFPEIWSDSSFSRNYSVNIKLRTPDCDVFSWYINIFVPLVHLICLAAPRQVIADGKTNPNAYGAPFLIRCFYKGLFSVEMGMIAGLSISKGADSSWTVDGLPTQVDVSLDIKDLYDTMSINQYIGRSSFALMKNTAMVDYIATSCGCNINKPDITRMIDLWIMQKFNLVHDIPRKAWLGIQQRFANDIYNFFKDGKITI